MKTVLYVDHTAKLGGGEIALCDLIGALDKTKFKAIVALASDGPLVNRLREAGIETYVRPLAGSVVDIRKDTLGIGTLQRTRDVAAAFKYATDLGKWARREKVDVIHTNSLKSDIFGGIAGWTAGIPVIWHVRDSITSSYLPAKVAVLFRMLARIVPRAVIANSKSTMSTLRLPNRKPKAVVYSGIQPEPDISETKSNSEDTDIASGGAVVTLVGRIAEWKGQHILIEAAANVLKTFPETRFWIVGSPLFGEFDYERKVKDQAASLGIAASVSFLGFRNDIPDILRRSTIIVHASTIGEPFGQVVVQGMAAGKPVIATDGGALPEIVDTGVTGLLVPMGDARSMSAAIEQLLSHPDEAVHMGELAKRHAHEHFSITQSVCAVQSLYDSVLRK